MTTPAGLDTESGASAIGRLEVRVRGVVQGVGFRPFVARLADELGLAGEVGNDATSVFVDVEGPMSVLDSFVSRLATDAPPLAAVVDIATTERPTSGQRGFRIVSSRTNTGERTLVPPDVATCADCLAEMADPADRRFRHPFITCTNCGPRFTIIEDLPYDRPATTMRDFPLCALCATEYADPADRRHHAQPVSCHDCGPRLWAERGAGRVEGTEAALAATVDALRAGGIVAIKGIGGFHLVCDATDERAVARLRTLKHRPAKPLAVMVRDTDVAADVVDLDPAGLEALSQQARPIVLLPSRARSPLAASVAPGLNEIGVLLPYAPVHHLLLAEVPMLVMTSGNLSDEPLCYRNDDARSRLGAIADVFLMHDRTITVPCEDSVVTVVDGHQVPIRRSRGFAPLPVLLQDEGPCVLAVGAEVKNAFALTRGDLALCSAHIGDMGSLETLAAFEASVAQLTSLHGVEPELIVADEHPGYHTTVWATNHSDARGVPLELVQHHHAHFASLLAEHRLADTPALGVVFDGTGYSCDTTVWGGEILHSAGDIGSVSRVGHLEQFGLAGGDKAVAQPWRVAMSLLRLARIRDPWGLAIATEVPTVTRAAIDSQLKTGVGVTTTSSAGRLFDGVAALLGLRLEVAYEAQAAMELEALARHASRSVRLHLDVDDGVLGLRPLVTGLVDALRDGAEIEALALGFHEALADATALLVIRQAAQFGVDVVGLTGGVMQNRLLVDRLTAILRRSGLRVLTHRVVPPNDGGLALGQAVVGRARLRALNSGPERGA